MNQRRDFLKMLGLGSLAAIPGAAVGKKLLAGISKPSLVKEVPNADADFAYHLGVTPKWYRDTMEEGAEQLAKAVDRSILASLRIRDRVVTMSVAGSYDSGASYVEVHGRHLKVGEVIEFRTGGKYTVIQASYPYPRRTRVLLDRPLDRNVRHKTAIDVVHHRTIPLSGEIKISSAKGSCTCYVSQGELSVTNGRDLEGNLYAVFDWWFGDNPETVCKDVFKIEFLKSELRGCSCLAFTNASMQAAFSVDFTFHEEVNEKGSRLTY